MGPDTDTILRASPWVALPGPCSLLRVPPQSPTYEKSAGGSRPTHMAAQSQAFVGHT